MKIAVSSSNGDIEGNVDPRFGRCSYFILMELEDDNIINHEIIGNEGAKQIRGAGLISAEQIASINPDVLITGTLGPHASAILLKTNIKLYSYTGSIKEAIKLLTQNKLSKINSSSQPKRLRYGKGLGIGFNKRN